MATIERNPFTYSEARKHMNERKFRNLLSTGEITRLSRGLYQWADAAGQGPGDPDLIEIAIRAPRATLALASALSHHGLVDDIPFEYDIAIPRGTWAPRSLSVPITWHHFDPKTFDGQAWGYYHPAKFETVKRRINFNMNADTWQAKPVRRVLGGVFDWLANRNDRAQYFCERFWGNWVGMEEGHLWLRAVK